MGLKVLAIDLGGINKDYFLRSDFDYFEIKASLNIDNSKKLKSYLTFIESGKPISIDDYQDESDNIHIVVRNIVDGKFEDKSPIYITDEKAEELKAFRLVKDDIVMAISSNCGLSFYYNGKDDRNLTLSHYLVRFRVNQELINPIYLNYYINSRLLKRYFRSVETGKTLKNLSKYYIKEMPVIIPEKHKQDEIISQIEPIEKNINELKSRLIPITEVINKVFSKEFGFDENLYNELGKGMTAGTQSAQAKTLKVFEVDFDELPKNKVVRFSTRYHNPPTKKLMDFLNQGWRRYG